MNNKGIYYLAPSQQDRRWGFYATGAGHGDYQPKEAYPASIHSRKYLREVWANGRILDEFQMVYIHRGKGTLYQRKEVTELKAGDLFFLFPGVWHTYSPSEETGWEEYWIGFKGEWADHLLKEKVLGNGQSVLHDLDQVWMLNFFTDLLASLAPPNQNPQRELRYRVIQLLESLVIRDETNYRDPHEGLLGVVKEEMNRNFRNHLPIQDFFEKGKVAVGERNMSYSYFRSLFKKHYGRSPGQFIDQLRMSEAKKLLHMGQDSIKEISEKLGFENPYYFSRFFKKHQGMSPKHFC